MTKPLHLIYILGLGDHKWAAQNRAVQTWRWWGVEAEAYRMMWADKVPWETKFNKLLARIDDLNRQGKDVALVGASAGATAVINAFAARMDSIVGVVLIAGKINRPENIDRPYHRERHPSFVTSANNSAKALEKLSANDRKRILSRYALADKIVPPKDSFIPDAKNQRVLTVGHVMTIASQILFGAPSIVRFLRKLQASSDNV